MDDFSVLEFRFQRHILGGGRENSPANSQHLRRNPYCLRKISSDVCQCRKKKIAEAVPGQTASGRKTILKQFSEKMFVFRERDHAVANVAWREHTILSEIGRAHV